MGIEPFSLGLAKVVVGDVHKVIWGLMEVVRVLFLGRSWHLSNYISGLWFFWIQIFHYLNFKYAHVLFMKIFTAIHNAWSISFNALSELWKFYWWFLGRIQQNLQVELGVICLGGGYHLEKQVGVVYCNWGKYF